jgi:hypothetical protein
MDLGALILECRQRLLATPDSVCLERARLVTEAYARFAADPIPVKRAKALHWFFERMSLDLETNPIFAGNLSAGPRRWMVLPEYGFDVPCQATVEDARFAGFLDGDVIPAELREFWRDRSVGGAAGIGHLTVNLDRVLRQGLSAIAAEAETLAARGTPEQRLYRSACALACRAVIHWAGRYAVAAQQRAEALPPGRRQAALLRVAAACRHVPEGKTRSRIRLKNTGETPKRITVVLQSTATERIERTLAPGAEQTLDILQDAPKRGQGSLGSLAVTESSGDTILQQTVPLQGGFYGDRTRPLPGFALYPSHFGGSRRDKVIFASGYDPIANRFYGRIDLAGFPAVNAVKELDLTLRKGGATKPLLTLKPRSADLPEAVLNFHTLAGNGVVLEWLAPADGNVDLDMEAAHWYGPSKHADGEAMTVFHVRDGVSSVLMPRTHYFETKVWKPIKIDGIDIKKGDRIQFYYDPWEGCGCDAFILRGELAQHIHGVKKIYTPGGDFSASVQGGTTGTWFYRFDTDRTPNPDGVYEALPQPNWTVQQAPGTGWGRGEERGKNQGFVAKRILSSGGQPVVDEAIPVLEPGVYQATATARDEVGNILGVTRYNFIRFDHQKDLPWIGHQLGVGDDVQPPWTGISGVRCQVSGVRGEKSDGQQFSVWGRDYRVDGSGLFSEMNVATESGLDREKRNILAGPVRFEMVRDGKNVELTPGSAPTEVKIADHQASWAGVVNGDGWRIETDVTLEYDGYAAHTIRIIPPKAASDGSGTAKADALRLIIPLKPKYAFNLHAIGGGEGHWFRAAVNSIPLDRSKTGQLWHSGQMSGGGTKPYSDNYGKHLLAGNVRPYVWLGGANRGIAFMADSDEGWVPADKDEKAEYSKYTHPSIEVVSGDSEQLSAISNQSTEDPAEHRTLVSENISVPFQNSGSPHRKTGALARPGQAGAPVLRREPEAPLNTEHSGEAVALVLNLVARPFTFDKPRTIRFSLQATPIKPVPDNWRHRRLAMNTAFPGFLRQDDYTKNRGGDTYAGWGWMGNRIHVDGAYWVDGHGSTPYPLNWDQALFFRQWAEKQGDAVTPYQGLHSALTFTEVDDPRMAPGRQASDVYGYLYPHMSHNHLDGGNGSGSQADLEYRLWNYAARIEGTGSKGLYFDLTEPVPTANPHGGFGYFLDLPDRPGIDGKAQAGYGMTRLREFFKRLRQLLLDGRAGKDGRTWIWMHSTDGNTVSAFAFTDILLEGENLPRPNKDQPWISKKIPAGRMQVMNNGAGKWGFQMTQLDMRDKAGMNEQQREAMNNNIRGWYLLHDVMQQAGLTRYEGIDIDRKAVFLPYWDPDVAAALAPGVDNAYASAYLQDNGLAIVVVNDVDQARTIPVTVAPAKLGIQATADAQYSAHDARVMRILTELRAQLKGKQPNHARYAGLNEALTGYSELPLNLDIAKGPNPGEILLQPKVAARGYLVVRLDVAGK